MSGGSMKKQCGECGVHLRDVGEYHPFAFCAMVKAGLDPWWEMRLMTAQLGLPPLGPLPPLVTRIVAAPELAQNRRRKKVAA